MRKNVSPSLSLADSTAKGAKRSSGYCVPEYLADPRKFLDKYASPLLDEDEDRTIMLSAPFGRASDDQTFAKTLMGGDACATALSWMDRSPNPEINWAIKAWTLDELASPFLYVGAPRDWFDRPWVWQFKKASDILTQYRFFFERATPIFDNDGRSAVNDGLTAAFYAILRPFSRWPFDAGFSFGVEPNPILDPAPILGPGSRRPVNVFEFAAPQYCCASIRCWEAGDANPAKFLTIESCVTRGIVPLVTVLGSEFNLKADRIAQAKKWADRLAPISDLARVFVGGVDRSDLVEIRNG